MPFLGVEKQSIDITEWSYGNPGGLYQIATQRELMAWLEKLQRTI